MVAIDTAASCVASRALCNSTAVAIRPRSVLFEAVVRFVQLYILGIGLYGFYDIFGIALIRRRAVNLECKPKRRTLSPCKFHQQSVHNSRDLKPGTLRFDWDTGKKPFRLGLGRGPLLVVLSLFGSSFVRRGWLLPGIVDFHSGWSDSVAPYKQPIADVVQSVCSVITLRAADSVFVWFTKST